MKKLVLIFTIVGAMIGAQNCFADEPKTTSDPIRCADVQFILARGSGAAIGHSGVFYDVESAAYFASGEFSTDITALDLDYPATNLYTIRELIGAYTSAGRAYEFGRSVKTGAANLRLYYRAAHAKCPSMKFGLVGYSQGAMVIADAAKYFDPDKVLFLMMLGDPETYLPEGEGLFPAMCGGGKPSPWRVYVPNCRTASGVFGARKPYELETLKGKYALFCNRNDYICGSTKNPFNNFGHVSYDGSGMIVWGIPYLLRRMKFNALAATRGGISSVENEAFSGGEVAADEVVEDAFGEPSEVAVSIEEDRIRLKWEPILGKNQYLLIRLNGFDLGYVSAESGAFEIRDIDQSEENRLTLIWMDKDGNTGKPREVDKSDESVTEQPLTVVAPVLPESVMHNDSPASGETSIRPLTTTVFNNGSIATNDTKQVEIKTPKHSQSLGFANRADVVNVVISMLGAGGLLAVLFMRRRRGN